MGEMRNAHKILVGNSGGKKPLGRPRRRWECNTEVYSDETECDYVD
jgi:hypothetical protein